MKTVFIETLDDDEFCVLDRKRIPSVDVNDIDSTPYEILCLIYDKGNTRSNSWSRPYGGVLWLGKQQFLYLNLYKMKLLPQGLVDIRYKHTHEMLYSKVMKQWKTYRLTIVFIVSLEFLEYGYYEFGEFGTRYAI